MFSQVLSQLLYIFFYICIFLIQFLLLNQVIKKLCFYFLDFARLLRFDFFLLPSERFLDLDLDLDLDLCIPVILKSLHPHPHFPVKATRPFFILFNIGFVLDDTGHLHFTQYI